VQEVPELAGALHDRVHVLGENVPGRHRRPERLPHLRQIARSVAVAFLDGETRIPRALALIPREGKRQGGSEGLELCTADERLEDAASSV
jgi:hypothetical protein